MNSMKRKLTAAAAALTVGAGLLLAGPASPAAAASSCQGTHVSTKAIKNGSGTRLANIGIYRSGAKYCAVLVKAGPVYGVGTKTYLKIDRNRHGGASTTKSDGIGDFKYQTDALTVDGTNSSVYVWGFTTGRDGKRYSWGGYVKR